MVVVVMIEIERKRLLCRILKTWRMDVDATHPKLTCYSTRSLQHYPHEEGTVAVRPNL